MNCHLGHNESLETTLVMCVNNRNHPNHNMVVPTSLFVSYDVLCVLVQVEPPLFTTDDDVLPNAFERPADSGTQQGMESTTLLSVDELLNSVKFSIFCIYVCMYVYG